MKLVIGTVALCMSATAPAFAQTQAQQDRLDRVARLVVTAPICKRLGMTVDPDLPAKVEAAFKAETDTWQVDPASVDRLKVAAIRRQSRMFGLDLDTAATNAKTEEQLRGIRTILFGYLLAQMNLLLHGLEAPEIDPGNALRFRLSDIGERERVEVSLKPSSRR